MSEALSSDSKALIRRHPQHKFRACDKKVFTQIRLIDLVIFKQEAKLKFFQNKKKLLSQ